MPAFDFADVVNPADILVTNLSGYSNFAMKTRQRGAISEQVFGKKFHRDGLAQFEIVSAIDFAHTASAQQTYDPITLSQHRARHKARVIDRIERRHRGRWSAGTIPYW